MSEKKEKPNTNTQICSLSKTRSWVDFINNDATLLFPDKDLFRKRLMHTMLEWSEEETSIELMDFAFEMKLRREWLLDLANRYPDFKEAYDYVKLRIGSRRRKGALLKKFDKEVVFRDEHVYDPERHAVNKYHADLKTDQDKQAHTFNITFEKPKVVSATELKGEVDETI